MLVVTGANGLMGTELAKHLNFVGLTRDDMDITKEDSVKKVLGKLKPDLVLHLAAYTDVVKAETEKQLAYDTNVIGTRNIAMNCKKLIYVSTEYVFDGTKGNYNEDDYPNPVNFYGLTKLLGEYESRKAEKSVVLRMVFKSRPYKHSNVVKDTYTSGDYVDIIAPLIKLAVLKYDYLPPTLNLGTGKKLLKDLALQSRPVGDINIDTLPVKIPLNTSLDLSLWNKLV